MKTSRPTLREQFLAHVGQTTPSPLGIEIQKAEGVFLLGPDGKKYIDLISGVSVSNVGHARAEVVDAVCQQARSYMHLMVYGDVIQQPQVEYATKLASLMPVGMSSVYFVNSGSEANEAALKLAKRVTGRYKMACFQNAYHGSSQGALSVMGDESYRYAFRPLLPAVTRLRFNNPEDLEKIDKQTACVIVEPVQGEAGVIVPQNGFLKLLRQRCSDTGALLIFDEVQTGFGRTGKMFAMDKYFVVPDMVTLAKALGGGMPLGALVCAPELMNAWQFNPTLGHITTFGGHPVCCAAGLAALNVLLKEGWIDQVDSKTAYVKKRMMEHPQVVEVRDSGLLLAVDMKDSRKVQDMIGLLTEEGALADWFLFDDHSFRISPPLCITMEELDLMCNIVWRALDRIPK